MTRDDADARVDRASETAQVVLVGAVAIAFIIVGLVLVANTVLYTESVGSERSLDSADATADFQRLARDEAANVVYRVNERNNFSDRGNLDDNVTSDVSALSNLLAAEYGQRSGVFVNVSTNLSASEYGARIEQDDEAAFNNTAGGGNDWDPVESSNETRIEEFGATFNVSEMPEVTNFGALPPSRSAVPFELTIDGASETRFVYVFNESGNLSVAESSTQLTTIANIRAAATGPCDEIDVSSRIYVDVSTGRVPGTNCTFNGTSGVTGPLSLSFDNADNAVGTYSFVVEDDSIATSGKYDDFDGTDTDDPYSSFVYWSVVVGIEFDGSEVSYDLSREIPIYGDETPRSRTPFAGLFSPVNRTAGVDTPYELNYSVDEYGSAVEGDKLSSLSVNIPDEPDNDAPFDNVDSVDDIEQIGIDTNGDGAIDEPIPDAAIDELEADSSEFEIEFDYESVSDEVTLEEGDDVLIRFNETKNPADSGEYDAEVTVNEEDSARATETYNVTSS